MTTIGAKDTTASNCSVDIPSPNVAKSRIDTSKKMLLQGFVPQSLQWLTRQKAKYSSGAGAQGICIAHKILHHSVDAGESRVEVLVRRLIGKIFWLFGIDLHLSTLMLLDVREK